MRVPGDGWRRESLEEELRDVAFLGFQKSEGKNPVIFSSLQLK